MNLRLRDRKTSTLRVREAVSSSAMGQLLRVGTAGAIIHNKTIKLGKKSGGVVTPFPLVGPEVRLRSSLQESDTVRNVREVLTFHPRILIEADSFNEEKRVASVIIIEEGKGNNGDNHYYFADTITQAVTDGVFDGAQAYADHPTLDEDINRPERSIRDLIGYYFDSFKTTTTRGGVTRVAYAAKLKIFDGAAYDWVIDLIKAAIEYAKKFPDKALIGISINADGAISQEESPEDGMLVAGVRLITRAFSGDVVTKPARGGGFISLRESVSGSRSNNTQENKSVNVKLLEAARKLKEQRASGEIDAGTFDELLAEALKESDGAGTGTGTAGAGAGGAAAGAATNTNGAGGAQSQGAAGGTAAGGTAAGGTATGDTTKTNNGDTAGAGTQGATGGTAAGAAGGATTGQTTVTTNADGSTTEHNPDGTQRVLESVRTGSLTLDQVKTQFPAFYEQVLREAQKTTGVPELQQKVAGYEAAEKLRESAEGARTKLKQSKLLEAAAIRLLPQLVGKTPVEQDQLIEAEVRYHEALGVGTQRGDVRGAGGQTVQLREAENNSNASMLLAGVVTEG